MTARGRDGMIMGCCLPRPVLVKRGPEGPGFTRLLVVAVLVLLVLSGTSLGHSVATGGLQHGRHMALLVVFPHDLLYDCVSI